MIPSKGSIILFATITIQVLGSIQPDSFPVCNGDVVCKRHNGRSVKLTPHLNLLMDMQRGLYELTAPKTPTHSLSGDKTHSLFDASQRLRRKSILIFLL
jgi:hypothetical protein